MAVGEINGVIDNAEDGDDQPREQGAGDGEPGRVPAV